MGSCSCSCSAEDSYTQQYYSTDWLKAVQLSPDCIPLEYLLSFHGNSG